MACAGSHYQSERLLLRSYQGTDYKEWHRVGTRNESHINAWMATKRDFSLSDHEFTELACKYRMEAFEDSKHVFGIFNNGSLVGECKLQPSEEGIYKQHPKREFTNSIWSILDLTRIRR